MRIVAPPGVFRPLGDTRLLARHLRAEVRPGAAVLDLCTGSGALAVVAALAGAGAVWAVDVSGAAVLTALYNARRNGVRVRARRGDLFEPVRGERFDLVVSNPPYVPAPSPELPRRGPARAWDAGRRGRALVDRICAEVPVHLRPGGAVLLVHTSLIGEQETLERLASGGLEPDVVERVPGRLGPLLSARAELLEEQGLLERGKREEDLVVVRGRAP